MSASLNVRAIKRATPGVVLGLALVVSSVSPSAVAAAGVVSKYVFAPSPVAPTSTLAAGATVAVTVSARDATNLLVPGATIFLALSQTTGGGTAAVGATALTATPVAFVATTGQITVSYHAPAVLPMGGKDILKAQNTKTAATITATDIYSFARASRFTFAPSPIAPPGTLSANGTVAVTVTALNSSSVAVAGDGIYLSFTPAAGGGHAAVGLTALTTTPVKFVANATGQVVVTYTLPATLPATGIDLLVAADSSKNATISKSDAYSFAGPTAYAFSPNPIAATATLAANATRTVTLTATDATLHPVSGARIYLSFTQTTAGGTAWVVSKQLSITMNPFLTNSAGHITITYKASATPPATGTDTIHASNLRSGATLTASDAYTY